MQQTERMLLSGNEAVALAARRAGVALGSGYPGTPSTEILENFAELGGEPSGRPTRRWPWRWRWARHLAAAGPW